MVSRKQVLNMRGLKSLGWTLILACLCATLAPVMAEDPGGVTHDPETIVDAERQSPELTPDEQMGELLSALVEMRSKEQDVRAVSEVIRHEAYLLEVAAGMLEGAADCLDSAAVSLESSMQTLSSTREPVPKFGEPVSEERFRRLTRGVNMSHWFSQSEDGRYEIDRLESTYTPEDFALIRGMGFRHVRYPFDENVLFNPDAPGVLNAAFLEVYDRKLDELLEAGLAVIVVIQPSDAFKHKLLDPDFQRKVITFWHTLAKHLSGRDPDRVFLEVLNEPTKILPTVKWRPMQGRLLAAMRAGAPDHTLIASGGDYSGPKDLLKLEPYADRNIIYNYHYYRPFAFTHQGASWGKDTWASMSGLPWPMDTEGIKAALATVDDEAVRMDILGTTWIRGTEQAMRADMESMAAWAVKYDVRVTANELGVYTLKSDRESRLRWHKAMASNLDELGIGWAIWDYSGGFDVIATEDGKRVPDPQMLEALGLSKTVQPQQE
jgi:endoglucanase